MHDVLIIGGGVAGLSAAIFLGRCRHRVLVVDAGNPRNAPSHGVHGFISRDGIVPLELLGMGRDEASRFGVEHKHATATRVEGSDGNFSVTVDDGERLEARKLLFATGIIDTKPEVPGFWENYAQWIFHCPFCDGWENRDKRILALATGEHALTYAINLKSWSPHITLCTHGPCPLDDDARARLERHRIPVIEQAVTQFEVHEGKHLVRFANGSPFECDSVFFSMGQTQHCHLAGELGCVMSDEGGIEADNRCRTTIPGVYAAGDATRDVQQAIVAAAEGVTAAFGIHSELRDEDRA